MKKYILTAAVVFITIFAVNYFNHSPQTEVSEVSAAQVDYFLKIPGIPGESKRAGHEEEIEILSWSWGETQEAALLLPAVQSAREAANKSAISPNEIEFEMNMSKASPKLMEAVASGKIFEQEVVLTGYRATGEPEPYLLIKMKPVYITSYQTGGSNSDTVPVDTISLNFGAIKFEYRPLGDEGRLGEPVVGMWDFENNASRY